jgi:hypothetical protein
MKFQSQTPVSLNCQSLSNNPSGQTHLPHQWLNTKVYSSGYEPQGSFPQQRATGIRTLIARSVITTQVGTWRRSQWMWRDRWQASRFFHLRIHAASHGLCIQDQTQVRACKPTLYINIAGNKWSQFCCLESIHFLYTSSSEKPQLALIQNTWIILGQRKPKSPKLVHINLFRA